jgi:hypothetical protein
MCTGAELLMATAVGAQTYSVYQGMESRRDAKNAAANRKAEEAAAEAKAAQSANAAVAMRKNALAANSLFTGAGESTGRSTLGV